ncbi:MAG: YpmS family protein [Alkalibacterium sp.]|nr:YpmS family protein [Alkalibacterium sp.]
MAESRGNRSRKTNGWMWAFLILVTLLIAAGIWVFMRLQPTQQSQVEESNEEVVIQDETMTFEVLTDKEQLNRVINLYLENELDDEFSGYTLNIDEDVELAGALQVFGFDVDFTLLMDPYVTDEGNLQLRATSIQLGTFELPIGIAMNVLSQQLDLPHWVRIDSEQQFILVALNEFQLENGVQFSMQRIDLSEDDVRVNIILPEESVR